MFRVLVHVEGGGMEFRKELGGQDGFATVKLASDATASVLPDARLTMLRKEGEIVGFRNAGQGRWTFPDTSDDRPRLWVRSSGGGLFSCDFRSRSEPRVFDENLTPDQVVTRVVGAPKLKSTFYEDRAGRPMSKAALDLIDEALTRAGGYFRTAERWCEVCHDTGLGPGGPCSNCR